MTFSAISKEVYTHPHKLRLRPQGFHFHPSLELCCPHLHIRINCTVGLSMTAEKISLCVHFSVCSYARLCIHSSLCVYVCVCLHAYLCVLLSVCLSLCICVRMHVSAHASLCVPVCASVCMSVCASLWVCISAGLPVYLAMSECVYMCTHAHLRTPESSDLSLT